MTPTTYAQAQALIRSQLRLTTHSSDVEWAAWQGLYDALDSYDSERGATFATWARRRIRGRVSNQRRDAGRALSHVTPTAETDEFPAADAPSTDPRLRARLAAAFAALPQRQANVARLVLVDGRTHEEAAAELGVTPQAVTQALARARVRLRRSLAAEVAP